MTVLTILVVGNLPFTDWADLGSGLLDDVEIRVNHVSDQNEALEAAALGNPDLCLLAGQVDEVHGFLTDLSEAGLRIRVVPILPSRTEADGRVLRQAGAFTILDADGALPQILPHLVIGTADRKREARSFRDEREELIRQLLDVRDEQERVAEQSEQLIQMAEDLHLSKETLERLNSEKNRLFSIVAHDLRSPFNSILGFSELLATTGDKLTPAEVKDYAQAAHLAASNVFKLMQTLLEWARLQMDQVEYEPAVFPLEDVASRTVNVYATIAREKGIDLRSEISGVEVYCDPGMIDTVIRNLVNNAVKFTAEGGAVTLVAEEQDGMAVISVKDTGVGMTAEQLEKCFSLSGGIKTFGTSGEAGTGLGLLMCKDLVEKNGGQLSVKSEVGQGTCFSFTAPCAAPV